MQEEYTGKGIFSTRGKNPGRRSVIPEAVIGRAPADAVSKSTILTMYLPLREEVEVLFDALEYATRKDPTQLATVSNEGIKVVGGRYFTSMGPNCAEVLCIEPESFRTVLKPHLDQLLTEKKAAKPVASKDMTPDYVGLSSVFPNTFGYSKLHLAVMNELKEKLLQRATQREDGAYDIAVDGVAFAAKLNGLRTFKVAREAITPLAGLAAGYDNEHIEYLKSQGKKSTGAGALEKWQALITTSEVPGRGRG